MLYTRRGSASGAISSLHRNGRNALEASLRQDRVARSSLAPAASVQKTWRQFRELYGPTADPLPITPQTLVSIGAMFKTGKYWSFANYATSMKKHHIEAGYD